MTERVAETELSCTFASGDCGISIASCDKERFYLLIRKTCGLWNLSMTLC